MVRIRFTWTILTIAATAPGAAAQRADLPTLLDSSAYIVQRNITIATPDGARLCAMVVRPRVAPPRLPTVFRFTIYADSATDLREARLTVSHQYVSVTGYVRGKMCSPDTPWPYVHDGDDAATIIEWIARQPWSDGRVAMYSGSYEGFTQWAAAKRMPKALKTIMTGAAAAPGIDVPMEGNVVWNFIYSWPFYTTDNRTLDTATYNDQARWTRLSHTWYTTGRAYRDMPAVDGTPNPVWEEWIAHPSYDAYWQHMIPFQREFARIGIPVLQTAGYFYGGPGAALYYFTEHYKYRPNAEHYLVIGPYDHFQAQRGVVNRRRGDTTKVISGYTTDSAAWIDIVNDLRFQWFDYVLKHGPKPALLAGKLNYEVMGANEWKHEPSVAGMSDGRRRFYLSSSRAGNAYRLSEARPTAHDSAVSLTVNLADRSDVDANTPGGAVLDTAVDVSNGLEFVSDPLAKSVELSGLFSGVLELITNKKDFDFAVSLFELKPDGKYLLIPPFQTRASYANDRTHRHLLTPGKRERLSFQSIRLASVQLEGGSRLVVVLQVIKNQGQEINYGTGKRVADETIADAGAPLTIQWLPGSFIEIPVASEPRR
jgi:putative CocE/NonD family hydrolase